MFFKQKLKPTRAKMETCSAKQNNFHIFVVAKQNQKQKLKHKQNQNQNQERWHKTQIGGFQERI